MTQFARSDQITVRKGMLSNDRGAALLLSSLDAYARVMKYDGKVSLSLDYIGPNGNHHETRAATVRYNAPQSLELVGNDSNDDRFHILLDGDVKECIAWYEGAAVERESGALTDVLMEYCGVSLDVAVILPSLLLGIEWHGETLSVPNGKLLSAFATDARYVGDEKVYGVECQKIICERQVGTWMFYLGKQDHLVRRIEITESVEQMAVRRRLGGGGVSGELGRSRTVQEFTIEHVSFTPEGGSPSGGGADGG